MRRAPGGHTGRGPVQQNRGGRLRGPHLSAAASLGLTAPGDSSQYQVQGTCLGPSGRRMLAWVLSIQVVFALASGAALVLVPSDVSGHSWPRLAAAALVVILLAAAVLGILRFSRAYCSEKIRAQGTADLIDIVLSTSGEWLWAVDDHGFFTFSSKTSATMLGYQPWELIGNHCRIVIELEDLALARQAVQATQPSDDPVPAPGYCSAGDKGLGSSLGDGSLLAMGAFRRQCRGKASERSA